MNSSFISQSRSKVLKTPREEEESLLNECRKDTRGQVILPQNTMAEETTENTEEGETKEHVDLEVKEEKTREVEEQQGRKEVGEATPVKGEPDEEQEKEYSKEKKDIVEEVDKRRSQEEHLIKKEPEIEKRASLAQPEDTDEESELKEDCKLDNVSLHKNFDDPAGCKKCFEILNNSMQLRNRHHCNTDFHILPDLQCSDPETARMFDETYTEDEIEASSEFSRADKTDCAESLRASHRSLARSYQSLASSKGFPSKHSLTLDLECRICHDAEGQDLISPCHCAGTSKWVHESCIIRWIRHTKTKQCEICTCPIKVKRKKKPVDQWTRPSASCGPCNKLDIWYCFVVVLCIFIIISFVVLQHRYDVTDQVETTVIFASIYVLCTLIILMKLRYFWTWFTQRSSFWGNWKNLNEEWRIVEAAEPNVNSPVSPV